MSDHVPQGTIPTSPTPPVEPASQPRRKSDLKTWLATGAVATVVAVAAVVGLGASGENSSAGATPATGRPMGNAEGPGAANGRRPFGNGVAGTVTKVDGTTLTVTSKLPNLAGGDQGAHDGERSGSGPASAQGTATTFTVKTTASTKFTKSEPGTLGELAKGQTVVVVGTGSDGTIAATQISQVESGPSGGSARRGNAPGARDGSGAMPGKRPEMGSRTGHQDDRGPGFEGQDAAHAVGTITSIKGSTITLKRPEGGTVTVTTTSATKVTVTNQVTLDAIAKGDHVRVIGTLSGTTVRATAVHIGDPAGTGRFAGRHGGPHGATPSSGAAPHHGPTAPPMSSQTS